MQNKMNDELEYAVLVEAIHAIHRKTAMIESGIAEEIKSIDELEYAKEQLIEAVKFSKNEAPIVSIGEYRDILNDIDDLKSLIERKESIVEQMVHLLKQKDEELKALIERVEELEKHKGDAVVIPFKKPEISNET